MNRPPNTVQGEWSHDGNSIATRDGQVAITLLLLTVLALAIAGGGIFPWTVCLTAGAGSLALAVLARRGHGRDNGSLPSLEKAWNLLLIGGIGTLLFVLITLVPLPGAAGRLMPRPRCNQNLVVNQALEEGRRLGLLPMRTPFFSLTRNRAGTMRTAVRLALGLSMLLLASLLGRRQRENYLLILIWLGTTIATAGVVCLRVYPQGDTLWWFYPLPHADPGPVAGFVNPNHFAGFLAMLCPVALVLLVTSLCQRRFVRSVVTLVPLCVMSAAIFLSLSRGALISWGLGLLAAPLFLLSRRTFLPALLAILCAASLAFVFSRSPPPGFRERIATLRAPLGDESAEVRLDAWRNCVLIWCDYPIIGAGGDSFRTVYPQYRLTSRRSHMTHAENEYAQLLAEGGIVGVLLAGLLIFAVIRIALSSSRLATVTLPVTVGAASAGVVVASHAMVEFALRLPLYTAVFASLAGTTLGAPAPFAGRRARFLLALACLGTCLILLPFSRLMGTMDSPDYLRQAPIPMLARAVTWAPTSWHAWYEIGRRIRHEHGQPGFKFGEACATRAAAYDPNNYLLWVALGKMRLRMKDYEGARIAFARAKQLRYWVAVPEVPPPERR